MRMSCNGCRVLRKGCSKNCSLRPCLDWIKTPEAQANATVFLAKFYGRAGLMNLINAGPEHLRPAIFRSLLHEACGRILNPMYGSVGLLWSGSWQLCQAAVEAVLKGEPVTPITPDAAADGRSPPLKAYDIRHVIKDENSAATNDRKRAKTRRPRRTAAKPAKTCRKMLEKCGDEPNRSSSHESSLSHQSEVAVPEEESKEMESTVSAEMVEAAPPPQVSPASQDCGVVELELTLGLEPVSRARHVVPVKKRRIEAFATCKDESTWEMGLRL